MSSSRATLRTEVLYRLGDADSAIWSAAEINGYLDEGHYALCSRTGLIWAQETISVTADTATYDVSDNARVERVTWDDRRLEPLWAAELESTHPAFEETSGDPDFYVFDGDGMGTIRLVPVPDTNNSTDLVVEYTKDVGDTADSGETYSDIPAHYARYLRFFVLFRALERDGEGQDLQLADHYSARYEAGITRISARMAAVRATRRGCIGAIGRRGRKPPRPRLPWNYGEAVK